MHIFVIDPNITTRELLVERIQGALNQTGLRRGDLSVGGFELCDSSSKTAPAMCFLGPGCYQELEPSIQRFRSAYPTAPLAVVLDNEVYATEAVELRRELMVRMMPLADVTQMAQFILDTKNELGASVGTRCQGLILVVQLKGGVGATTLATSLGACYAAHGLTTALVDLDDVNPQVTAWGGVPTVKRKAVADMLRFGSLPNYRIKEVTHAIDAYEGQLNVVPQPERYQEGFQFKADIQEGAPSSADFVRSLVGVLEGEYDVTIVDCGRSWGISTFALLPYAQHILWVLPENRIDFRCSLSNFHRLYREADDSDEFDLSRWKLVVNNYSDHGISLKQISEELSELELFPDTLDVFTVNHSERIRYCGGPGKSLYEVGESSVSQALGDIAFDLVPFRRDVEEKPVIEKLRNTFSRLVS